MQRFFRTEAGGYGDGDRFLGVRVPLTRRIVREFYRGLSLNDIRELLASEWHEVRLAGVLVMAAQAARANDVEQAALFKLYVDQLGRGINNWDIIDASAAPVLGAYAAQHDADNILRLARGGLWHKRAAALSTFHFLRRGETAAALRIAEAMVQERHDLLQKAVGWMLREMGKVDGSLLTQFLSRHAGAMPRTMLRYAIERLPEGERRRYLDARREAGWPKPIRASQR